MRTSLATLVLLAGIAIPSVAQRPAYKREVPPRLLRQAKISEDSAVKVASARVPSGQLRALALENEKGKLIWSVDFYVPNLPYTYEVHVNALDGTLGPVTRENLPARGDSARGAAKPRT